MFWWKIDHILPYHGEMICEVRYVYASGLEEVIEILKQYIHPDRVNYDFNSIRFIKIDEYDVERDKVLLCKEKDGQQLRNALVSTALAWQLEMGVAPSITSTVSEYDATMLVGCSYDEYCSDGVNKTAVTKGYDFIYNSIRYQVKACRPSGKTGSKITKVPKAKNYEWDKLIWILYDERYIIQEAWEWNVIEYKNLFENKERLSPDDMRRGLRLNYTTSD